MVSESKIKEVKTVVVNGEHKVEMVISDGSGVEITWVESIDKPEIPAIESWARDLSNEKSDNTVYSFIKQTADGAELISVSDNLHDVIDKAQELQASQES